MCYMVSERGTANQLGEAYLSVSVTYQVRRILVDKVIIIQ